MIKPVLILKSIEKLHAKGAALKKTVAKKAAGFGRKLHAKEAQVKRLSPIKRHA